MLRGFPWYPGAVEGGEAVQEELTDKIDVPTGEVFTGKIYGLDGLQNDNISSTWTFGLYLWGVKQTNMIFV